MRAKTILTVLFLVSLGVAAVILLRAMALNSEMRAEGPEALVASVALTPGTLLRAEDVAWHRLAGPAESGAILRPDATKRQENPVLDEQTRTAVYGGALRIAVAAGESIRN